MSPAGSCRSVGQSHGTAEKGPLIGIAEQPAWSILAAVLILTCWEPAPPAPSTSELPAALDHVRAGTGDLVLTLLSMVVTGAFVASGVLS
jgi:hypothetical protein